MNLLNVFLVLYGRCFELFYFGETELEAHLLFAEFSQLLRQKNKLLRKKNKVFEVEYLTCQRERNQNKIYPHPLM